MLEFEPVSEIMEKTQRNHFSYGNKFDKSKGLMENAKVILDDFLGYGLKESTSRLSEKTNSVAFA